MARASRIAFPFCYGPLRLLRSYTSSYWAHPIAMESIQMMMMMHHAGRVAKVMALLDMSSATATKTGNPLKDSKPVVPVRTCAMSNCATFRPIQDDHSVGRTCSRPNNSLLPSSFNQDTSLLCRLPWQCGHGKRGGRGKMTNSPCLPMISGCTNSLCVTRRSPWLPGSTYTTCALIERADF